MVRERNAASAALVVAVITLSQWPVVDSSPLQLTTVPYQPGFASWGTSSGVINSL